MYVRKYVWMNIQEYVHYARISQDDEIQAHSCTKRHKKHEHERACNKRRSPKRKEQKYVKAEKTGINRKKGARFL